MTLMVNVRSWSYGRGRGWDLGTVRESGLESALVATVRGFFLIFNCCHFLIVPLPQGLLLVVAKVSCDKLGYQKAPCTQRFLNLVFRVSPGSMCCILLRHCAPLLQNLHLLGLLQ